MTSRVVRWGELHNIRDLGGLPGGRGVTRFGRIFRSPSPDRLDASGWLDLDHAGVRTLVDLRNQGEIAADTQRPPVLPVKYRPLEDQSDEGFMAAWGDRLGSPAYYPEVLRRWPGLVAAAVSAIADAPAGAVLVHCGAGRDRTGMISAMLLDLAGVERAAILEDYEEGVRETNAWLTANHAREKPRLGGDLDAHVTTALRELNEFLDAMDVANYLLDAGVTAPQLAGIRSRLLD